MRKINTFIGTLIILLTLSCEGEDGAPGPPGEDGINILGTVLEIEGTFSAENDYTLFFEFPENVAVFESDVVLVYLLFDQTTDSNGEIVDIWRLLPQTRILDQGLLQYNYDYTFFDVALFLEADFDLNTLLPGDTDNQIFRIAIVPAEFGQDTGVDVSNLDAVMGVLEFEQNSIQQIVLD
ncbi:MAG: collagen-like protein [Bacteroidota bacterium]